MKLYIYDHCPYCLKARMIFGLKNIPVELHVLLNDDAETPTRMVGQKQVPILQKDDSRYMPESMDIVHYVDKLDGKPLLTGKRSPAIEACLSLTLLYPIARWSEKHFRLEHRLMAGLLIMSLSMMPVGMVSGLQQLFTLICLFYIGSIIAEPARETLSASLADARARGSYMGFSRLGLAIGGAIGYIGGGWLFDLGKSAHQPELPWMMLGIIGIFTFLALGWQFSQKRTARRLLERDA